MIFTDGIPQMVNGPLVGMMYNKVITKSAEQIITVDSSNPQYIFQLNELEAFKKSLRYGTIQELREWYNLYSKSK